MADRAEDFFAFDLFNFVWDRFKVREPSGRLWKLEDVHQPNESQRSEFNHDVGYMVIAVQMCIRKEWNERIVSKKPSLKESRKFMTTVEKFISEYVHDDAVFRTYFSCAVFAELSMYFHGIREEESAKLVPRLWCKYFRAFIRKELENEGGWEELRSKASVVRNVYDNVSGQEKTICSKLENKLTELRYPYEEIRNITLVEIFIASLQQWGKHVRYTVDYHPSSVIDIAYQIIEAASHFLATGLTKKRIANEELIFLLILEREFMDKVNDVNRSMDEITEASMLLDGGSISEETKIELWRMYLPHELVEPEFLNSSYIETLSSSVSLKNLLTPYYQNIKDVHLSGLSSTKNRQRACLRELLQLGCSMKEVNANYKRYINEIELSIYRKLAKSSSSSILESRVREVSLF